MKKFLLLGLMVLASAASVAAAPVVAAPVAQVTSKAPALAVRSDINCGFICDSFGRCRRVCW